MRFEVLGPLASRQLLDELQQALRRRMVAEHERGLDGEDETFARRLRPDAELPAHVERLHGGRQGVGRAALGKRDHGRADRILGPFLDIVSFPCLREAVVS